MLLSSLQVTSGSSALLSSSSSPRTQPPACSKQSVLFLVPPAGVSWICTGFVPGCQEGSFLGLRNAPLLVLILHFTFSRKPCHPCSRETPTRTGTRDPFLPLGTTHLRKPSSHWSPSFLGLSDTPTLYLLQGSHPHLRHRVLGTPLTSAVRDVPTEESLLLSLVQQRWVFKQQERRDQIPSQGREKAKRRSGRHPQSPPSGPLNPTALRRWQRMRRRRLLEVCSPPAGALGAAHLFLRAHHAGAARPRCRSNKGAPIRRRAAAGSVRRSTERVSRA